MGLNIGGPPLNFGIATWTRNANPSAEPIDRTVTTHASTSLAPIPESSSEEDRSSHSDLM
jgi:hypothetical protein